MKKRLFIVLFICFLCVGCNGNITRDIRHDGFSVSGKFVCSDFIPSKNNKNVSKIKFLLNNFIISTDGELYELSLSSPFSNNQNCKKVENVSVKAVYDESVFKGTDNKYYYLTNLGNVVKYSEVPTTDNNYELYDLLLKDEGVLKVETANSSNATYYSLKNDGIIYSNTLKKNNNSGHLEIGESSIAYDKDSYSADIVDFSYSGNSLNTFIKTTKEVFRMKIVNQKECDKYTDVECKYEMKSDDILEKHSDNIIGFSGNNLITYYGTLFSISS